MAKNDELNILIAEDEYINLMGLKSTIKNLGHHVVGEALNGVQAVQLALEVNPDLIIMDIKMPELDGLEAISKINKVIRVPCIVITGYNDKDLIKKASNIGVFSYLLKPVSNKELEPAIEMTMSRYEEFNRLNKELIESRRSLSDRKYIERAKGILMDTMDIKESEAMKLLQKRSRNNNIKLVDLAIEIINASKVLNMK